MPKEWNKRDKESIVQFVLSHKSTWDVKKHFGFNSYQAANLCVWRAFKSLGVARPRFSAIHTCSFCGKRFTVKFLNQYCCHSSECIRSYHRIWNMQRYYALSGRRGPTSSTAFWGYCMERTTSQIRGTIAYHTCNDWEHRLQWFQSRNRCLQKQKERQRAVVQAPRSVGWSRAFKVAAISAHFASRSASITEWEKVALNIQRSLYNQGLIRYISMPIKTIPIGYIRGLLVAQKGRCAISGVKLHPHELHADHIVPLSRVDLSPTLDEKNIWLVHKSVNIMKGTMTYSQLIESCRQILGNHDVSSKLITKIGNGEIVPLSKKQFDLWAQKHCPK